MTARSLDRDRLAALYAESGDAEGGEVEGGEVEGGEVEGGEGEGGSLRLVAS